MEIPIVGRTALEDLKPIEAMVIREEEAKREAEEEAQQQSGQEDELEVTMEVKLQKELGLE